MNKQKLIIIKDSDIIDEIRVCPACKSPKYAGRDWVCCGNYGESAPAVVTCSSLIYFETDIRRVDDNGECIENF